MEKLIMARGWAVRISDIPRKNTANQGDFPKKTVQSIVIFLLHGYLESIEVWDDFTTLLTPHARVIAMDIPGHGISEVKGPMHTMSMLAEAAVGVLDSLGVEKCVVVGHSMGGYVALEMLHAHPERLAGLVLFHSSTFPDSEEKRAQRVREIEVVESGKKGLLPATVERAFAAPNRKRMAPRVEDMKEIASLAEENGILALLRGMGERPDRNEVAHGSNVPQLFIFGRHDELIPEQHALEIIEANPHARVVWLENSGHMGFIEEAELSARTIAGFACEVWPL